MRLLHHIAPQEALRPYIREIRIIEVPAVMECSMPSHTDQFLQFYLEGGYEVVDQRTRSVFTAPRAVVVGQQTKRNWDLQFRGRMRIVSVCFRPNGFHQLFRIPMTQLTDTAVPADAVLGSPVLRLQERLYACTDHQEIEAITSAFFRQYADAARRLPAIDRVIDLILQRKGLADPAWLARQACMSQRQLERRFNEQVGVSPKAFMNKVRFDTVVKLKQQSPARTWTDLTYEAGYADQSHLIRDFRQRTADTPTGYLQQLMGIPEVSFPG